MDSSLLSIPSLGESEHDAEVKVHRTPRGGRRAPAKKDIDESLSSAEDKWFPKQRIDSQPLVRHSEDILTSRRPLNNIQSTKTPLRTNSQADLNSSLDGSENKSVGLEAPWEDGSLRLGRNPYRGHLPSFDGEIDDVREMSNLGNANKPDYNLSTINSSSTPSVDGPRLKGTAANITTTNSRSRDSLGVPVIATAAAADTLPVKSRRDIVAKNSSAPTASLAEVLSHTLLCSLP